MMSKLNNALHGFLNSYKFCIMKYKNKMLRKNLFHHTKDKLANFFAVFFKFCNYMLP